MSHTANKKLECEEDVSDAIIRIINSKNKRVKLYSIDLDKLFEKVCNHHLLKNFFGKKVWYEDGKLFIKDCNKLTTDFNGADDRLVNLIYNFCYGIGYDDSSTVGNDDIDDNNGKVSLKERLRIVEEVFTGEFTSDDYCQKYDISEATASTDISKLIELKKLVYLNKRRGRRRVYSTSICNEQKRLDSFEDCDKQNTVTVCI
jgi:hypothetical protein